MKKRRKICYITGTRADYGLMKNTLIKLKKEFDLSLIVVGMHLSPEFGNTFQDIEKDGFKIAKKIKTLLTKDTGGAMAKSLGVCLIKITQALDSLKPELLLVLGDRGEALAGAIAGAHLNIPVTHIHGGDQGDDGAHIDDPIRHSITKFAHIHLSATEQSAERIIKMGEEKWRVHIVGSPALDDILLKDFYSKSYIEKKYNLNLKKPLLLVVQHPVLTQINEAEKQARETLEAVKEINEQTVFIYPNADAGGRKMIKTIKEYEKYDFLQTHKSIPRKDYLSLMKYSSVLIGNSSSGIIESPVFKIPVVNIGVRNSARENAGNIIFINHNKREIIKAIKKALFDERFKKVIRKYKNPYGAGNTSKKIVKILRELKLKKDILIKKITY